VYIPANNKSGFSHLDDLINAIFKNINITILFLNIFLYHSFKKSRADSGFKKSIQPGKKKIDICLFCNFSLFPCSGKFRAEKIWSEGCSNQKPVA
jgi:hypothetical protein